jgi:tRNA-splicing endonuclease subunit Sen2
MNPVKKRRRLPNYGVKPFPIDEKAEGIFTGLDVEIFDKKSMKILTEAGCYGFNSKPRQTIAFYDKQPVVKVSPDEYQRKLEWKEKFGAEDCGKLISVDDEELLSEPFDIPKSLILLPEEAFFLIHQIKCLEVKDLNEKVVTAEQLWKFYCEAKYDFVETYVAYLYLKSKNWVIKAGTKFGGNFLLYKHNPQFYHATFVVRVVRDQRTCYEHQSLERISETTKKCMIYIEVYFPEGIEPCDYLKNLQKFTVKEVAFKRQDIKEK